MTEIDTIIGALQHAAPGYLYFTLFFFAFLENLFPPSPSDLVIAFGGTLVGFGKLNMFAAILFATLGSTAGFVSMYYLGFFLGRGIIDSGKLKFLPLDKVKVVEGWFTKYGYWIVIGNRFLSGTRAIISFVVGLSELPIAITLPLCAASALLWNTLLVLAGSQLGHNWRQIEYYLSIYGTIIVASVGLAAAYFIAIYFYRRRRV
ncbi:MAG: DedA family protein [Candidatus Kryptoniota bacterium]